MLLSCSCGCRFPVNDRTKYGWVKPWLRPRPVPVVGASDMDRPWHVVCGATHTAVHCVGGHVYIWGENAHGELGNGGSTSEDMPRLLGCGDAIGSVGSSASLGRGVSGEYVSAIAASGWYVLEFEIAVPLFRWLVGWLLALRCEWHIPSHSHSHPLTSGRRRCCCLVHVLSRLGWAGTL